MMVHRSTGSIGRVWEVMVAECLRGLRSCELRDELLRHANRVEILLPTQAPGPRQSVARLDGLSPATKEQATHPQEEI